ncbi:hypothetical protein Pelo_16220 [Pelomyxa schiedti]|nr:hypothetical protein Pelo_16220 [Pelomyxa schiedti]
MMAECACDVLACCIHKSTNDQDRSVFEQALASLRASREYSEASSSQQATRTTRLLQRWRTSKAACAASLEQQVAERAPTWASQLRQLRRLAVVYTTMASTPPPSRATFYHQHGSDNWIWTPEHERDLVAGIMRHGWGAYEKVLEDPSLSFAKDSRFTPSAITTGVLTEKLKQLLQ